MKKAKIIISLILILLISQLGVLANARIPVYMVGNVFYFFDNSTGAITGFAGEPVDVILPSAIGGYKVLSIGYRAFLGATTLNTLAIPDGVTLISDEAFASCPNLTSVEIGADVTNIGSRAFANCPRLSNVILKSSCSAIAEDAFYNTAWTNSTTAEFAMIGTSTLVRYNGSAEVVTIPDGVKEISANAFANNPFIKKVILPDTVEKIGTNAFVHCYSLEEINIPTRVSHIGAGAFDDTIWMYNQKSDFVVVNGILISYKGKEKHVELPDGITAIGSGAFMANETLVSVHIPDSVIYIDSLAFSGCCKLRLANIPEKVEWIDEYAFAGCSMMTIHGVQSSYSQIYAEYMGIPFSTEVYVSYNGSRVYFDNAVPIIYYDRTYLPLRALMEMMGFTVSWDAASGNVACVKGNRTVLITPAGEIRVNGILSPTVAPPINKNGSNLVSARVIAEAVNAQVGWDESTRTVLITN